MNPSADPIDPATARASGELGRLTGQVATMRAVLIRLLQDVVVAENRLTGIEAAQLLEANERLVVAAVQNQVAADTAAQALDEVSRTAELDALTQLPNRMLLLDRFTSAIANASRHGTRLGVLYLDIDNFKQINDTFGHAVGDEALKRVARCLTSAVRAGDTVSRHGGDEFLVLLTEVSQASDAIGVADKVMAMLDAAGPVGDPVLRLSASIGISLYPDDAADAVTLIQLADAAMYRAKRHAPGSCALHGHPPSSEHVQQAPAHESQRVRRRDPLAAGADPELRHAHLREANERLVLAALSAQELQAAAESAQRRQAAFLAGVADELNDPQSPIRIAAAQLGWSRTDELLLPRAQAIIDRQVAHMSRLVGDLLDVSRGQPATLRLDRQRTDMTGVVHKAVEACRPGMVARRQHLDVRMPGFSPEAASEAAPAFEPASEPGSEPHSALAVDGDPVRLAQVLSNLLDNASKYTPDGGKIALSVTPEKGRVVIAVSDNGIGITPEALPGIFDPFVQDTHAIGFNGTGAGIGLTAVKALTEAHGGTVVASSAGRGLGSRFVVTLPLMGSAGKPEQPEQPEQP